MGSLGRFVLVVILQNLEEQKVTGPSRERFDLVIVASSNPFVIAESVRQVGDARVLHYGADFDWVLRLVIVSIESRDNKIQWCGNKFGRWRLNPGWLEPSSQWQIQVFGLCNSVMYCLRRACSAALTTLMTYMMACAGEKRKKGILVPPQLSQSEIRAQRYDDNEAAVLSVSPIHNQDIKKTASCISAILTF